MARDIYPDDFDSQCGFYQFDKQSQSKPLSNEEFLQQIDKAYRELSHPNCRPMEIPIQDFMLEYVCLDCGRFFSIGDMSYKKIEMCPHCQSSADKVQRIGQ